VNLTELTSRIEITFWDLAIWLLSKSTPTQILLRWCYSQLELHRLYFNPETALLWSGTGLILGFVIGYLCSIILL